MISINTVQGARGREWRIKSIFLFGQFRRLAWRILRGVDVEQAYRQAAQEMGTELDWEHAFDLCVSQ